ncbi:hypothetical protein GYB22_12395 [bacterium]|nr:hypothetical protein [bacterium]
MKKSFSILTTLLLCISSFAQSGDGAQFTLGPMVKTNGFGLSGSGYFHQEVKTAHGFSFQISSLKHSREFRIQNQLSISPKTYFYGKLNRAFQFNPSYQFIIKEGVSGRNAASLSYGFEIGPSFAFTRPVYLIVMDLSKDEGPTPMVEQYDPAIHSNQDEILGDAGWTKGFNSMQLNTGIHIATFFNLDWNQDYFRKRLNTGISLDYYFRDLQLMHKNQNRVFGSIFITYQLGKNR